MKLSHYLNEVQKLIETPQDFIAIKKLASDTRELFLKERMNTHNYEYGNCAAGLCAVTSLYVQKELRKIGYNVNVECIEYGKKPKVWHHCFIKFKGKTNNYILDITADQFEGQIKKNIPKIVLRIDKDNKKSKYKKVHHIGKIITDDTSAGSIEAWIKKEWPIEQSPKGYKKLFKN